MIRKSIALVLFVAFLGTFVQAEEWNIDKAHSSIGFSVRHLVVSKTRGDFDEFTGMMNFDGKNLEAGSVEFTIQTTSIDTDNEDRDKHLRSDDFFSVEKFPEMVFKSKKIVKGDGDSFKLIGDLTIRDVTKEVTFEVEFNGVVTDPWGGTRAGFSAESTIDRKDFNITWSKTLDGGGLVVGDDVKIIVEVEWIKS